MSHRIRGGWLLVAAIPAVFVAYFFVYPVARILALGLSELSLGSTGLEARLVRVGWFTLWQAGVSTALTLLFAAPMTWAIANYHFPGRRLALALVTAPFVLPTVVVGTAFVAIGWRDSLGAILAAHVFFNTAVVVRTVGTLWSRLDPDLVAAARILGDSPWRAFRRVTLPLIKPAIAAASSIVFLFTFTSFGVVLILGGFRYATLEVEIYRQAVTLFDVPLAASLAIVQLAGVTGALYWYSRFQERHTATWALRASPSLPRPRGRVAMAVGAVVSATIAALMVPIALLVIRSVRSGGYGDLITRDPVVGLPIRSLWVSFGFALVAMSIGTAVGVMAAAVVSNRRGALSTWFDLVLMLPLGTSAVTIGFGFIIALDWPVDLRAGLLLVPVAQALVAVPFVVRATAPTAKAIDPELREAAAVLATSPSRVWWRVDLPILSRAIAVGAGFAFIISLGEFGATTLVARPNTVTMPLMIFRLLSRPGSASFGMAMALSVILALATIVTVLALDRARVGELGTF